jgi:hypothetical protein
VPGAGIVAGQLRRFEMSDRANEAEWSSAIGVGEGEVFGDSQSKVRRFMCELDRFFI